MSLSTRPSLKPWQYYPATQVAAVAVVYLPVYLFALATHLSGRAVGLTELLLYPLLVGGGAILVILLLLKFVCGEGIACLNFKPGRRLSDIAAGIMLAIVLLLLFAAQQSIVARWFPRPSELLSQQQLTLFTGLARNPVLVAIWLGPVVWIGVAGFEEISRVFMLNRFRAVWNGRAARWLLVLLSAFLFGLVHIYQAPANVIAIGLQGLVYGWYYLTFGRVWPMIIAHGLYDSVQVVQVVMLFTRL
jgi:membrane protease YdiL (CAAX protease family)